MEVSPPVLPEAWKLQSFRKSFKGRTVDVLPEAWELRSFPKSFKGITGHERSPKEHVHHGDGFQIELIMLLATRCLQRREIKDFSIIYQSDEYPSIILKYTTEDNEDDEKRLRLHVRCTQTDSENKRLFKSDLIEMFLYLLPQSDNFTNTIVYTNMEWKQKSNVLEKIHFQPRKTNESYRELQRLGITDNCYRIGDVKRAIEEKCSEELKEFLDQNAFNRFNLSAEQANKTDMRAEVEKYFENEYKLNPRQSAELAEFVYKYFFEIHPWSEADYPVRKANVLAVFDDQIQKLDTLLTLNIIAEEATIKRDIENEAVQTKRKDDNG